MSFTFTLRDCGFHPFAETLSVYVPGARLSEKCPDESLTVEADPAETLALAMLPQVLVLVRGAAIDRIPDLRAGSVG